MFHRLSQPAVKVAIILHLIIVIPYQWNVHPSADQVNKQAALITATVGEFRYSQPSFSHQKKATKNMKLCNKRKLNDYSPIISVPDRSSRTSSDGN